MKEFHRFWCLVVLGAITLLPSNTFAQESIADPVIRITKRPCRNQVLETVIRCAGEAKFCLGPGRQSEDCADARTECLVAQDEEKICIDKFLEKAL